jgi:hypothetical protein
MLLSLNKIVIISVVMLVTLLVIGAKPSRASAAADSAQSAVDAVCAGLGSATGASDDCVDPTGSASVSNTVKSVIDLLSLLVGVAAVIMIIIGGLQYVMSGGDSGKVGNSKNTILYAVVGLIVVALAQVIVRFTVESTK